MQRERENLLECTTTLSEYLQFIVMTLRRSHCLRARFLHLLLALVATVDQARYLALAGDGPLD